MWLPIKQKTVQEQLLHQYVCVPAVPSHGSRTHPAKTGNPSPTPAQHADPLVHLQPTVTQPLPQQEVHYIWSSVGWSSKGRAESA